MVVRHKKLVSTIGYFHSIHLLAAVQYKQMVPYDISIVSTYCMYL